MYNPIREREMRGLTVTDILSLHVKVIKRPTVTF